MSSNQHSADFYCDLFKFHYSWTFLDGHWHWPQKTLWVSLLFRRGVWLWAFSISCTCYWSVFHFTSCHCFSPFGPSFQLLVRRASLLIYPTVRSLLPLDRLGMERQCVYVCLYLCGEEWTIQQIFFLQLRTSITSKPPFDIKDCAPFSPFPYFQGGWGA